MKLSEFPERNMELVLKAIDTIKNTGLKNPFEICDVLKIEPVIMKIQSVPAFYCKDRFCNRPTIYVDNQYISDIQNLLCFHELGHILTEDCSFNLFNPRLDPVSEFTANAVAMRFFGGGVERPQINVDTKIENVNKYIGHIVASNGRNNFAQIPLDDPFWDTIY